MKSLPAGRLGSLCFRSSFVPFECLCVDYFINLS